MYIRIEIQDLLFNV